MRKRETLLNEYRFSGYNPIAELTGFFGDPKARVIQLNRIQKKQYAEIAALRIGAITTRRYGIFGIYPVELQEYI
jgi:hypothetical protein